jgi:hypothetical protein
MRFSTLIGALLVLIALARPAQAQLYYPGTVWNTTGNVSTIENANVISVTHAEQGIALKGFEAFALATLQTAGQHNAWEHRTEHGVGLRYTFQLPKGMVRANAAYVTENRFSALNGYDKGHLSLSMDAWFGWSQRPAPRVSTVTQ